MADERQRTEVWDVRAVTDDLSQRIWVQIQQRQRQLNTNTKVTEWYFYYLQTQTLSRHLYRLNSPAWCSRSARGCEWGWRELPGHQVLPGPTWTVDWKKGPGSEEKTPNHGNIRPPVKKAERKRDTMFPLVSVHVYKLVWWGSGSVPGCATGRARWAETDQKRSRPADSSAGFYPDADEWWD